ncbi:MAG: divergent polysaccharide deacetylase family protein [Gammaproteobacteria bacterium]|nr:divergent polysaccharide deacetylase family protein [Gammaproteobacteria bacterium]
MSPPRRHGIVNLLLALLSLTAHASGDTPSPAIAIIIDDMGNHLAEGRAALALPGGVTYAFLPHSSHGVTLAEAAHRAGKEVMLHLPMDAYHGNALGPGALTLHMTEARFKQTLHDDLASIPHVAGVNNHMGSLLTRHPGAMDWVMQSLQRYPALFFIDSRTTHKTVAQEVAQEHGVATTRRDVFLDNEPNPRAITKQFRLLLRKAREQGFAVGIGHPYPQTIAVLQRHLSQLADQGVRLIKASHLIEQQLRRSQWPAFSSPSLKVAKSSKQ